MSIDLSWLDNANCIGTDPDVFFPEKSRSDQSRLAKRICARCEVQTECFLFGLQLSEGYGIYGGANASKRSIQNIC